MTRLAACAALLALGAGCAPQAQGPSSVRVSEAWARASAGEAAAGAVYMTLESPQGDRLLAVSVPASVARFAQIHETARTPSATGPGELRMRHIESMDLPPGERVTFAPGQRHVMLLELARPLAVGDTIALALAFEQASPETIRVPVRDE